MDDWPRFDAKYLVGIEQVDLEHRRLFEIAARVYESLSVSDDAAQAISRACVADLLDYTATHFANEERLMEAAGYPELEEHCRQHDRLLMQANDMNLRSEIGDQYVPTELAHFLYRWLVDHIETSDKRFGEFSRAAQ